VVSEVRKGAVFVQYVGWSTVWDEWIDLDSIRLSPNPDVVHCRDQCSLFQRLRPPSEADTEVLTEGLRQLSQRRGIIHSALVDQFGLVPPVARLILSYACVGPVP